MDEQRYNGGGEMKRFVEVWGTAIASLCYCFLLPRRLPSGPLRLLSLLPVVALFAVLPLRLSIAHLVGTASFFLTWLANSKLLLLAFGLGPLSPDHISLLHFICLACLPIKTPRFTPTRDHLRPISSSSSSSPAVLALKSLVLAVTIPSYGLIAQTLHPYVIIGLHCCHLYMLIEVVLALGAVVPRALGLESAPQFDEPYLATSLQDFWGRRWNLMVTDILRQTVYDPARQIWGPALGRRWAAAAASVAAFLVSGLMHELVFYHLTRVPPTWEVTWFFVLQGLATAAESAAKRKVGWRLHRAVSGPLAVGFVVVTSVWLFWPPILRNGVVARAIGEFTMAVEFIRQCFRFRSSQ